MEYAFTTRGMAAKTKKSRLDKVQNMALRVILETMKVTPMHDTEKNQLMQSHLRGEEVSKSSPKEKVAVPPSTHKLGTAHPKSPQAPKPEPPVQPKKLSKKHRDIVDAPEELLTDPTWRPDRETNIQMFMSVPGITSKDQLPGELRNLTLILIADRFVTMPGLMSTLTGLLRKK